MCIVLLHWWRETGVTDWTHFFSKGAFWTWCVCDFVTGNFRYLCHTVVTVLLICVCVRWGLYQRFWCDMGCQLFLYIVDHCSDHICASIILCQSLQWGLTSKIVQIWVQNLNPIFRAFWLVDWFEITESYDWHIIGDTDQLDLFI